MLLKSGMNKGFPLGIFMQCLNICYGVSSCSKCAAYDDNYKTCYYSNPHSILGKLNYITFNSINADKILSVYSTEHAKINCTKCTLSGKHEERESACVFNQIKILCKLKHPDFIC